MSMIKLLCRSFDSWRHKLSHASPLEVAVYAEVRCLPTVAPRQESAQQRVPAQGSVGRGRDKLYDDAITRAAIRNENWGIILTANEGRKWNMKATKT